MANLFYSPIVGGMARSWSYPNRSEENSLKGSDSDRIFTSPHPAYGMRRTL
tara:strand:+ start:244 stop:396 length:153 start_codon:yes stop_codon:yes gene_type:complete